CSVHSHFGIGTRSYSTISQRDRAGSSDRSAGQSRSGADLGHGSGACARESLAGGEGDKAAAASDRQSICSWGARRTVTELEVPVRSSSVLSHNPEKMNIVSGVSGFHVEGEGGLLGTIGGRRN